MENSENMENRVNTEEDYEFSVKDADYIGPELVKESITPQTPEYKKISPFWFIVSLVAAVIILIVIILLPNKDKDISIYKYTTEDTLEIYSDWDNNFTLIFNTKGEVLHRLEQTAYYKYNQSRAVALIVIFDTKNIRINKLYYVDTKGLRFIEQNIDDFTISDVGNRILYTKRDNDGYRLHLFDVLTKEDKILTTGGQQYSSLGFSPDGNTVIYGKDEFKYNQFITEAFLIKDVGAPNPIPESIGKDRVPLAVSDGAKYLYYCLYFNDKPTYLYVMKDGEAIKLVEDLTNNYIYLNKDYSQIIFVDGNSTYLCIDGLEKIQILDSILLRMNLSKIQFTYNFRQKIYVISLGHDTLQYQGILGEDLNLRVIGENYMPLDIGTINANENYYINDTGNEILYLNQDNEIVKAYSYKGKNKSKIIIEHADSFIATRDLSEIYYIDQGNLYYCKGKANPVFIEKDVSIIQRNVDGTAIFFRTGDVEKSGSLYCCVKGTVITIVEAGFVTDINPISYGVLFFREDNGVRLYYYNPIGVEVIELKKQS